MLSRATDPVVDHAIAYLPSGEIVFHRTNNLDSAAKSFEALRPRKAVTSAGGSSDLPQKYESFMRVDGERTRTTRPARRAPQKGVKEPFTGFCSGNSSEAEKRIPDMERKEGDGVKDE